MEYQKVPQLQEKKKHMKKSSFLVTLLKQTIMPPTSATPTMPQPTSDQSHQTQH